MMSFLIKRNDEEQDIIDIKENNSGYDFRPNIKSCDADVKKITLYNSKMIDLILSKKIEKSFERLASITYDILSSEDDESTSDATIALDEVSKLRSVILNRYQKFLKKEKEEEYIKKLRFLENELRSKIIIHNTYKKIIENEELIEERGHSRWLILIIQ